MDSDLDGPLPDEEDLDPDAVDALRAAVVDTLRAARAGEPQAEMWMGAHPGAPSRTERGPLNEVIDEDPARELGPRAVAKFGPRLPFLLKILAAGAPLSLQVHPNLEEAKDGYDDEERRGVPVDAPHRNYKDANHKPELIYALTPFDALCGFRRADEDVMDAYQYFYDAGGNEVGARLAGTMEWDARDGHLHWHFTDFAQYNLLKADKIPGDAMSSFADGLNDTLSPLGFIKDRRRLRLVRRLPLGNNG